MRCRFEYCRKREKEKVQTVPGCSCYPGVCRLPDGYEFALEVPRGSKASLILYGKEEEKLEIPLPEESREGELLSVKVKGIREEIKYNYQIDGEVIQDPRARYLRNVQGFGEDVSENLCCGWKQTAMYGRKTKQNPEPCQILCYINFR